MRLIKFLLSSLLTVSFFSQEIIKLPLKSKEVSQILKSQPLHIIPMGRRIK